MKVVCDIWAEIAGAIVSSFDPLAEADNLECCMGGATTAEDLCSIDVLTGDGATGLVERFRRA